MDGCQIQTYIESIENDAALYEARNFEARMEAMDFIGFQVMDQLSALMQQTAHPVKLVLLQQRAEKLQAAFETIDCYMFLQLRAKIRAGGCTGAAFRTMVKRYTGFTAADNGHPSTPGYDSLDEFLSMGYSIVRPCRSKPKTWNQA